MEKEREQECEGMRAGESAMKEREAWRTAEAKDTVGNCVCSM